MFLFHSPHPNLSDRFREKRSDLAVTRNFFTLCVLSCLFAALLLGSCTMEPEPPYNELWTKESSSYTLAGTWVSTYDDAWTINLTENTLEYDDGGGYGLSFSGNIREIRKFKKDGTIGIIFIEYTGKPTDYATGAPPKGDFTGIYFRELTAATGQFASPVENKSGLTITAARDTLAAAKKAFTGDKMGNFVTAPATYTKK